MKKIKDFLKNNFITGFLILVPIGAAFTLIGWIIGKSDQVIQLLPHAARPETYLGFKIPGLGLLLTFLIIVLIGVMGRVYFVKFFLRVGEHLIKKIPFISSVYSAVKQLMETIFVARDGKADQRKVVIVEFPRKGIYSVGFLTSVARGVTQEKTKETVMNVFIPTTPNPTSGFLVLVPEQDVISTDMSVEDAFKLIMSGGIVAPPSSEPKA
jgi:uncharacterized membrane protein